MNEWISAAIAVGAGLVLGSIVSRIVRNQLAKSNVEALRESASPLGGLVFSGFVIVGLLVALGFVSPDDLDRLPSDLIAFLPKAISAAIVAIGGNIAATFAQTAVAKALAGSGAAARFAPSIVKTAIIAAAMILAAAQLGVDTTVINIAVAALLFGLAASLALLTGLGGRHVAGEVAAGRVWRRSLEAGDRIRARGVAGVDIDGVVIDIHPTAVEVQGTDSTLFVPNSKLMDAVVERTRPAADGDRAALDG
jgi:small-conductance mechanosensitive channel